MTPTPFFRCQCGSNSILHGTAEAGGRRENGLHLAEQAVIRL